ncbi:hypothetical protein CCUS01_15879 [Colletotrichum cuscutae]|uniref:Uncharacterized protein n=1 Tax=Colletotrichum cuscutae TaxID=1209917 RepID=A0AAI9VD94_9PEZI|nr:hypothetical protein CCUS01_15879 [Colletotrichum cuscutae]
MTGQLAFRPTTAQPEACIQWTAYATSFFVLETLPDGGRDTSSPSERKHIDRIPFPAGTTRHCSPFRWHRGTPDHAVRLAERDTAGPTQHSHLRKRVCRSGTQWARNRRIDLTESKGRRTRNSNRQATTTAEREITAWLNTAQHSTSNNIQQMTSVGLAAGNKCRGGNSIATETFLYQRLGVYRYLAAQLDYCHIARRAIARVNGLDNLHCAPRSDGTGLRVRTELWAIFDPWERRTWSKQTRDPALAWANKPGTLARAPWKILRSGGLLLDLIPGTLAGNLINHGFNGVSDRTRITSPSAQVKMMYGGLPVGIFLLHEDWLPAAMSLSEILVEAQQYTYLDHQIDERETSPSPIGLRSEHIRTPMHQTARTIFSVTDSITASQRRPSPEALSRAWAFIVRRVNSYRLFCTRDHGPHRVARYYARNTKKSSFTQSGTRVGEQRRSTDRHLGRYSASPEKDESEHTPCPSSFILRTAVERERERERKTDARYSYTPEQTQQLGWADSILVRSRKAHTHDTTLLLDGRAPGDNSSGANKLEEALRNSNNRAVLIRHEGTATAHLLLMHKLRKGDSSPRRKPSGERQSIWIRIASPNQTNATSPTSRFPGERVRTRKVRLKHFERLTSLSLIWPAAGWAKSSKQSRRGNEKHMRLVVARLGKKPISGDKEHGTQVSGWDGEEPDRETGQTGFQPLAK